MIRVTYFNYKDIIKEFDSAYIESDGYLITYSSTENYEDSIPLVDVAKIEKQVKDLTLEEIYAYIDNNFNGTAYLETTPNSIIIHYVKFIEDRITDYVEYSFNDYIDITEIVKEYKNEKA